MINLTTIPGRDMDAPYVPERAAWLRRYLAEMAAFAWTATYQAHEAELAKIETDAASIRREGA